MRTSIINIPHFAQCGRLIDTRYDSDGVKDVIESSPIYVMAEHYRTLSDPWLSSERSEIKTNSTAKNWRRRSASEHSSTSPSDVYGRATAFCWWNGPAVLLPRQRSKLARGRQRRGARYVSDTQRCNRRDRDRYRKTLPSNLPSAGWRRRGRFSGRYLKLAALSEWPSRRALTGDASLHPR